MTNEQFLKLTPAQQKKALRDEPRYVPPSDVPEMTSEEIDAELARFHSSYTPDNGE